MTDPIEFEVNEPVTKKFTLLTLDMSDNSLRIMGLPPTHPTTPAEFDVVARKMGYKKTSDMNIEVQLECTIDGVTYRGNEETIQKALGLMAERDCFDKKHSDVNKLWHQAGEAIQDLKRQLAEATSSRCVVDGIEFTGSKKTIYALETEHVVRVKESKRLQIEVNQLRGKFKRLSIELEKSEANQ